MLVVAFDDSASSPHHLTEGPERQAAAVGGAPALVPVDDLGEAVDVVEELLGEPALADPAFTDDRDEA